MRTRSFAAVAVLAAALLAPSAAFAAPALSNPAGSTLLTNGQIHFVWSDAALEDMFRVVSGDVVTGSCPTTPAGTVSDLSGDILPPFGSLEFFYTPPANGTACYYVEATDAVPTTTYSDPVMITYDTPLAVSVTTPAASSIVQGNNVTVSATATDPGLSGIARVDFFAQGSGAPVLIGSDSSGSGNTYSIAWDTTQVSTPDHAYSVWAVAVDSATLETTSAAIANVVVDNTHPTVNVTAPAALSNVNGANVTVSATASDAGAGITSVQFFADSGGGPVSLGTVFGAGPYSVTWNTTSGGFPDNFYTVSARATDGVTLQTTSSVASVRVDNTGPTGSITAPSGGALLRGAANLTAGVSDASGVASVRFEQSSDGGANWTVISTDSTAPTWTASWDTTGLNGSFLIHAVMTDILANPVSVTAPVAVTLDNTVPTVTLGGVTGGTDVRGTLSLTGVANGTGSAVASVKFGYRLGSSGGFTDIGTADTTFPYGVSFATTGVGDGIYDIQALVTDAAGNTATTVVSSVLIDNTFPSTPAAPTGLTSVSASPTITFLPVTDPGSPNSGIGHYDVFRNGGSTPINVAPIAAVGPYTWSDVAGQSTNPASGTNTYSYTVAAVDLSGNSSAKSAPLAIFMDATAASAPTSVLALASPTNQRPQVSWGAPSWVTPAFPIDHYKVYRNGSFLSDVAGTTFTDNQVSLPDNSYSYQVVAASVGDGTTGIASAAATVMYDTTAPATPAGVVGSAAIDGSVSISWSAASDGAGSGVARYAVRRALGSTPPVSASDGDATCQGLATSCADPTALNGKLYSYAVFATDRAGNTSAAGNAIGVTAHDQLAPAKPLGLSATPADASVALQWAAAGPDDDVAGYVLVAKPGTQAPTSETDGTRVCLAIISTSMNCTATGLTNGATYTFGLFALDEALNRSQPAVVSAAPNGKVTDAKAPAAVSKLKAKVSGHKVTLTWKNPLDKDFDHVEITAGERKPAALKTSKRVYSGKGSKAKTALRAGQSRWFVVVAYDAVGNASEPASVHVVIPAASKFGPAPKAKVHGKVKLTWPVAKGAKYYNVQVYAGKKRILVSWPAGRALQLPKKKLKRGTTYTWYVWPGLGAKAKAHYGKLIGRNAFTFTG